MHTLLPTHTHLHCAAQVVTDVTAGGAVCVRGLNDADAHVGGSGCRQLREEVPQQHGRQAGDAVPVKQ